MRITTRNTLIGGAIALVGVLITVAAMFMTKGPTHNVGVTGSGNLVSEGQQGGIAAKQVTINVASTPPQRPLKQRIREVLRTINPVIIEKLDGGADGIAVMVNQTNQPELMQLTKDPAFRDYLDIRSTGSTSMGAHNRIGGHLNDLNDVGMLNGYYFTFKPALRE